MADDTIDGTAAPVSKRKRISRKDLSPEKLAAIRAYGRQRRVQNLEKLKARERTDKNGVRLAARTRYRQRHLEKIRERNRIGARLRYRRDPEKAREKARIHNKRRRQLKNAEIRAAHKVWRDKVREARAGRPIASSCEVCGSSNRISFDHCHKTGNFRGWLCGPCNSALGLVGENPATLRKLARYLERTSGKPTKRAQSPLLDLMEQANGQA